MEEGVSDVFIALGSVVVVENELEDVYGLLVLGHEFVQEFAVPPEHVLEVALELLADLGFVAVVTEELAIGQLAQVVLSPLGRLVQLVELLERLAHFVGRLFVLRKFNGFGYWVFLFNAVQTRDCSLRKLNVRTEFLNAVLRVSLQVHHFLQLPLARLPQQLGRLLDQGLRNVGGFEFVAHELGSLEVDHVARLGLGQVVLDLQQFLLLLDQRQHVHLPVIQVAF